MDKILSLIQKEEKRQQDTVTLIPSENYASKAVREAVASILTNKYSEGYPGKRYYQGNIIVDQIEALAVERAKKLFKVPYANVQPYSGSPANAEVFMALVNHKDTILGMSLAAGGHLTHGHPITFSGKFYKSVQFGVNKKGAVGYDEVEKIAKREKPRLIIIGPSSYPLILDWKRFSEIAAIVNAWFVADISHLAGLIAAGVYPSPTPHAHIITTTTHKTLRGPRGAMIMVTKKGLEKDGDLAPKIDRAVFPGFQGGPHENIIAGIAQALDEALNHEFVKYAKAIVKNAKVLASELIANGVSLVANGTQSHLMVIDLTPLNLSGNVVAEALEIAGIIVNKNAIPNDSNPPMYPSGIRLGTPAVTTRGMGEPEMKKIAGWITEVIDHVKDERLPDDKEKRSEFMKAFKTKIQKDKKLINISKEVKRLCQKFPVPS